MLHIAQAMYCDFFVTEDQKHAKFAAILLTSRTQVAIYPDRETPVDQWFLSLVERR